MVNNDVDCRANRATTASSPLGSIDWAESKGGEMLVQRAIAACGPLNTGSRGQGYSYVRSVALGWGTVSPPTVDSFCLSRQRGATCWILFLNWEDDCVEFGIIISQFCRRFYIQGFHMLSLSAIFELLALNSCL